MSHCVTKRKFSVVPPFSRKKNLFSSFRCFSSFVFSFSKMLPFRSAAPCHHATSTSGVVLLGRFANVCNNYTKAWMRSAASSKYSASAFVENNSKNDSNISALRKHASHWSFSSPGTAFHFPSTTPVGHCSLRFASNCGSSSSPPPPPPPQEASP